VIPTRRLALACLVLALLSLATFPWPAARGLLLGLDLALVACVAWDFLHTPAPARLRLARQAPPHAGLSTRFERTLALGPAPGAAGLVVEVREEFPQSFEVVLRSLEGRPEPPLRGDPTGGPDEARLAAGRPVHVVRVYRAHLRGAHALGAVRLRVRGPLGLVQRQARLVGRTEVRIEPALPHLAVTLRLAASERWRDLGVRVLPPRGGQREFESLRDYVAGDDVRSVDWKAFAKRGRPYVRQFQVERGQELLLMVDCGRRMGATTTEGRARGWTKLDHALDAALELAAVALAKGDRVGILLFDSAVRAYLPPHRGERQLARLRGAVFGELPSRADSDLGRALREAAVRLRRRALLLVLSDVADPLSVEHQRRALASGAPRHRVLFTALDDPALRQAAAGEGRVDAALRAASAQQVAWRAAALRQLAGSGARVMDALPAEAAAPILAAWLDERRRGA
jgi:uncharacterized protein (DUF58 family)